MASELKPPYYVVNFSGGKDSTAMLLRLLELDMTVDEIIFCDTTAEFPQMYEHVDRVEKYI
ncbi:MAG: phosphoadenosine phosphosulfate reductase family protein, partial [Selenomonadaceae bacterium]|nr:phosphoadenosine phosphosulfate reductase family protein [Selenomonadaceae bacterium]